MCSLEHTCNFRACYHAYTLCLSNFLSNFNMPLTYTWFIRLNNMILTWFNYFSTCRLYLTHYLQHHMRNAWDFSLKESRWVSWTSHLCTAKFSTLLSLIINSWVKSSDTEQSKTLNHAMHVFFQGLVLRNTKDHIYFMILVIKITWLQLERNKRIINVR